MQDPFYGINPTLRGADIDEVNASGASLEEPLYNYARYGVSSALVSAATGLYNTGSSLLNTFGADIQVADATRITQQVFGTDAAKFYQQHQVGVDIAGLLVGGFGAGLSAVRAFRAAQGSGYMTLGMRAATGLKNPVDDIVLGSEQVAAAKAASLANPTTFGINNTATWNAIGSGFKQQMAEAFVFDAAFALSMNQHPLANTEDKGYFSAAKDMFVEGLPFTFAGGLLGGAITGFQIRGQIKKAWDAETLAAQKFTTIGAQLPAHGNHGNKLAMGLSLLSDLRHSEEFAVPEGSPFQAARKELAEKQIKSYLMDTFTATNKAGNEGLQVFDRLIQRAKDSPLSLEEAANETAQLNSLMYIKDRDVSEMNTFFGKTLAPTVVSIAKDADLVVDDMIRHLQLGVPDDLKLLVEVVGERLKKELLLDPDTREAFGWSQGNQDNLRKIAGEIRSGKSPGLAQDDRMAAVGDSWFTGANVLQQENFGEFAFFNELNKRMQRMEDSLEAAGVIKKGAGRMFPDLTPETAQIATIVHELTHYKTNGSRALNHAENAVMHQTKLGKEFEGLSRLIYPTYWSDFDKEVAALKAGGFDDALAHKEAYRLHKGEYALRPSEMIAQASQYVLHPDYMEHAAKVAPNIAKFFNKHGALIKPFTPRKAYKNVRTGEEYTSILPLPQDLGKVEMRNGIVRVAGTDITFQYDAKMFRPQDVEKNFSLGYEAVLHNSQLPHMKAASMFAAAAMRPFAELLSPAGDLVLSKYDLPSLERAVTEFAKNKALADSFAPGNSKILINTSDTDIPALQQMQVEDLQELLLQGKREMRFALTNMYQHNEWVIANSLNIDVKQGMNNASIGDDGMILMGKRNYSQAEHIVAHYTPPTAQELNVKTKSITALEQSAQVMREMQSRAAASVLGKDFGLLPSRSFMQDSLQWLQETATRASGLTAVRGNVGKTNLREAAQALGRVVRLLKGNAGQNIEEQFSRHYGIFNKPEAIQLRMELALATNKLYEGWYNSHALKLQQDEPAKHFLVSLEERTKASSHLQNLQELAAAGDLAAAKRYSVFLQQHKGAEFLPLEDQAILYAVDSGKGMKLSTEVGEFFEQVVKPFNQTHAQNRQMIAAAKGVHGSVRKDVLYPPPRDLRRSPHIAFVIPNPSAVDADSGRYMLYGKTAKELEVKMQAAKESYGDKYHVVTQAEISQYKKLVGEYEEGKVFDEWHFDPDMTRKGRAAEATPGLDIEASEVLDRFRNYQHRTSESQIMSAVELHYGEVTHALKLADETYGRAAAASITGKQTKDTIFADTLNLMLDKSSRGTQQLEMWRSVNSLVGEKGGRIIDAVVGKLGSSASGKLTEESFAKMNKELEAAGFTPPYKEMVKAIAASPDTTNSRSFETLVRTMNNLAGTFQLRLDMANSVLQTISTPILMLPVVREALKNSADVRNVLSVAGPTGVKEPTPMKLLNRAVARFWTPEGKQLMEEAQRRGIITDYLKQYVEAQDFSSLTGRHSLKGLNDAVDKLGEFGGKWSAHRFSEDFSRFLVISALDDVAKLRGMNPDEAWAVISNGVDTVHGIYRAHQRVQMFNGVIGQAIGMYQTYIFNWAQNMLKYVEDGQKRNALTMAAMQTSIFGIRSLPGFELLNQKVAETNSGRMDIYTATGADDPDSWGAWALYGLGSHAFIYPVDVASRGDMAIRHKLIVPTTFQDIPAVSILAKSIANVTSTVGMVAEGDTSVGNALLFGLAHNGLNRPLQGVGTIALGQHTTKDGTPLVQDTDWDYEVGTMANVGAIFSRLIGTRPLEEAIRLDNHYRQKGYQAGVKEEIEGVGRELRLAVVDGREISEEDWNNFANRYEASGAKIENFNAFVSRILAASQVSDVEKFRTKLEEDGPLKRLQDRLLLERESPSIEDFQ